MSEGVWHLSKAGRGILELVEHGPLNCRHIEIGIVEQRFLISILRSPVLLVARFIEVGIWYQNQTLD